MEYPRPDSPPDVWIAWYRWKLDDMDRTITALNNENGQLTMQLMHLGVIPVTHRETHQ